MSWQDELQQLDSALASGQISADEYRIRRDRAIAQASGQSADPGQQAPAGEATQVVRPVQPQAPGGERTQIVPGAQGPGDGADRTQVVPGHDSSSDSTQVVPGGTAAGHNPQFPPPPPPPPWETGHQAQPQHQQPQQQNMAPPWGGEDALPPEFGQQSWPTQGPEVFEESGSGNSGRIIAIVVAAILLLGGGGAAIWYFGFNKKDDGGDKKDTAQTDTKQKPTEKPKEDELPDGPFIELPGKVAYSGTRDREKAIAEKSPSEQDVKIIQNSDVESVGGLVTGADDETRRGIWAFKTADPQTLLTTMDALYEQAGFQLTNDDGVLIRTMPAGGNNPYTTIRAHYAVKGYMVRIEAYGTDANDVTQAFDQLKSDMLKEYPPEK